MRDLDFGRRFVEYAEVLDWPIDVVVEDLSCAPHLVLHRLQELRPESVVLVGSVRRGTEPPGGVRRYQLGVRAADPSDVHQSLTDGLAGVADLDHTLRVLRHWGALPADTVIVEVEPADTSFGVGFSEEVGSAIEHIVDVVRDVVGTPGQPVLPPAHAPSAGGEGVDGLVRYADLRSEVKEATAGLRQAMLPQPPPMLGLSVAARSRPLGTGVDTKGDWYDFVPLGDGWFGIAIGDVAERGLEAVMSMSHLRSALRTAALLCGQSPGEVVDRVDRVVGGVGLGSGSSLLFLAVNPASGEVRFANAGHCAPLLVGEGEWPVFVAEATSPRLGAGRPHLRGRAEASLRLCEASRLLLFTDGLAADVDRLLLAAATSPRKAGSLCEFVMSRCLGGVRREDDASLLVLHLAGGSDAA